MSDDASEQPADDGYLPPASPYPPQDPDRASLKAIHQGRANPMEAGSVNGGRICGIIATILATLLLVFGVGMFAFGLYSDHRR